MRKMLTLRNSHHWNCERIQIYWKVDEHPWFVCTFPCRKENGIFCLAKGIAQPFLLNECP